MRRIAWAIGWACLILLPISFGPIQSPLGAPPTLLPAASPDPVPHVGPSETAHQDDTPTADLIP